MKKILQYLFEHKTLSREMAKEVLVNIGKGIYNEHEITAFMTVYLMRSITIGELQGFREALLELCIPLDLDGYDTIDIVGTGGDGKNTFNISTLSSWVSCCSGNWRPVSGLWLTHSRNCWLMAWVRAMVSAVAPAPSSN